MSELERVRVWAEALIRLHLDNSWSFAFDRAARRAGLCDFAKKRITVSRHLAERAEDDVVHQTLLHEVAHALAGPKAGHGPEWKRIAGELGYVGGRTHDQPIAEDRARFRRPTRDLACGRCGRGFDRAHLIQWRAITR